LHWELGHLELSMAAVAGAIEMFTATLRFSSAKDLLDSRLCIRQLLKARITSNPAVELLDALYFHLA